MTDHPLYRRIRIFAFDPSLGFDRETASFALATVRLPWEESYDAEMKPGPANEYFEVIDIDPASGVAYPPVDLDDKWLLATDGHAPSESNPQFHQQMAFAVAMKTVASFERALGRRVLWGERRQVVDGVESFDRVERLRLYPHALREENAFYSPAKKALLFGYFQAGLADVEGLPGGWVFGCLSHDIVAHETTHAVLDGLNRFYIEDSGADALAFHEALADVVALMQHFTFTEAVAASIASAPALGAPSLLSGLARQFGRASAQRDAVMPPGPLRDAIGTFQAAKTDATDMSARQLAAAGDDPHTRGLVLVSAVFAAFSEVYAARARDLIALVSGRTALDPGVAIPPALLARLTSEAVDIAERILTMCIRAIDYLPPVAVTFGDFLRAVVTGDRDLFPDDDLGLRRAMIAGFRRYGLYPTGVRSLAEDSLLWPAEAMPPGLAGPHGLNLDAIFDRRELYEQERSNAARLHAWLVPDQISKAHHAFAEAIGLAIGADAAPSVFRRGDAAAPDGSYTLSDENPAIEIHHCRLSRRTGADGQGQRLLTVQVSQRRRGYASKAVQDAVDGATAKGARIPPHDFVLRGGCTLAFDLRAIHRGTTTLTDLRYCIAQPVSSAKGDARLEALRAYHYGAPFGGAATAFRETAASEPFAALHRG